MVARGGIEAPTRGFSVCWRTFEGLINQSLATLATPLPRPTKAHSWHTHFELVTFLAHCPRPFCSTRLFLPARAGGGSRRPRDFATRDVGSDLDQFAADWDGP